MDITITITSTSTITITITITHVLSTTILTTIITPSHGLGFRRLKPENMIVVLVDAEGSEFWRRGLTV